MGNWPFYCQKKISLTKGRNSTQRERFEMEVAIDYDPHHIISNRRKANKSKPFEHVEVVGLVERANWMTYPRETNSDEDMPKNSTSALVEGSPQLDLSCIIAIATEITHLAILSKKEKNRIPKVHGCRGRRYG